MFYADICVMFSETTVAHLYLTDYFTKIENLIKAWQSLSFIRFNS